MGLPMWQVPEEANANDAVAKLEKVAAVRRSTIRREPTVRPQRGSRAQPAGPGLQHAEQTYRGLRRWHRVLEAESRHIDHLEAEWERRRRNRMRLRARMDLEDENDNMEDHAIRSGAAVSRMRETLLPAPIEPYLSNHPEESSLRYGETDRPELPLHGSTSPRRYRSSRRPYIPSPPLSQERQLSPVPMLREAGDSAELTPNFAPARRPYQPPPPPPFRGMSRVIVEHGMPGDELTNLESPPSEEYDSSYPPLRRMGRRSPRPQRLLSGRFDGLGDRTRSLSPHSNDSREEDTWETLLTTIDSNDTASTTQNSFDSTRSESVTRSNRSSQTTATSFGEIGQIDDVCELDLPHGITEEDARELRARYQRRELARQLDRIEMLDPRPGPMSRYHEDDAGSDIISRHREVNSAVEPLRSIWRRLHRREDVPQELWMAAGVSPVVWDSINERERDREESEAANA